MFTASCWTTWDVACSCWLTDSCLLNSCSLEQRQTFKCNIKWHGLGTGIHLAFLDTRYVKQPQAYSNQITTTRKSVTNTSRRYTWKAIACQQARSMWHLHKMYYTGVVLLNFLPMQATEGSSKEILLWFVTSAHGRCNIYLECDACSSCFCTATVYHKSWQHQKKMQWPH